MADLALSNHLIDEYLKYKFQDDYNPNTIRKLFKFIQSFALRNDSNWMNDPSIPIQLESDPLIEIIDTCSDDDMVQASVLKLMLVDTLLRTSYINLNITNDFEKLKQKYGARYPNAIDKDKAQKHIKALLSDAHYVIITDGYIGTSRKWDDNKILIADIVPNNNIDLTIVGFNKENNIDVIDSSSKAELRTIIPNLSDVKGKILPQNIHDRYIETDKLRILISGGLEHLSLSSDKDFTYIVELR